MAFVALSACSLQRDQEALENTAFFPFDFFEVVHDLLTRPFRSLHMLELDPAAGQEGGRGGGAKGRQDDRDERRRQAYRKGPRHPQSQHQDRLDTNAKPTRPPPPLFALSAPDSQTHALARLAPTPAQRGCPTSHPPAQPQTLPRPLSPLSWPLPPFSPVPRSASALLAVSQPAIRVADAGAARGDRPARKERELEAAGALMLAAAAAGHRTGRRHHRT